MSYIFINFDPILQDRMKLRTKYVFAPYFILLIFVCYRLIKDGNQDSASYKQDIVIKKEYKKSSSKQTERELNNNFSENYTIDWDHKLPQSSWDLAASWVSPREVYPSDAPELGKLTGEI